MLEMVQRTTTVQNIQLNEQVRMGALRWLHSLNLDPTAQTYGVADREYWAWKTKDFANGTWQGGLAGFLDAAPLLDLSDEQLKTIVTATLAGTKWIQRNNGSFEEAYPFESSYCVTALVIFNLLYAYYRYPAYFSSQALQHLTSITHAGLTFIERTPETHGIISNHLATGAMAIYLTRDFLKLPPHPTSFSHFMALQHLTEGWFPEYGGSDPGYQTLLNYYLMAAHLAKPLPPDVITALNRSITFTQHFAFPDGSYAGEVGSRGTAIVYPSGTYGISNIGNIIKTAFSQWTVNTYLHSVSAVTPTNVDAGNFVPVLNAWALLVSINPLSDNTLTLPLQNQTFPDAGFWVFRQDNAMAIFSKQQSVLRRVVKYGNTWQDDSIVAFTSNHKTTQGCVAHPVEISPQYLRYQLQATSREQPLNTVFSAILLRVFNTVFMPIPPLQRFMKRVLAFMVMQRKKTPKPLSITIEMDLQSPDLSVSVHNQCSDHWGKQSYGFHTHMASANTFSERAL